MECAATLVVLIALVGNVTSEADRAAAASEARAYFADQNVPFEVAASECTSEECVPDVLRVGCGSEGLLLALWRDGADGPTTAVTAVLVNRDGTQFPGSARAEGDVRAATLAALQQARQRASLGRGPWLRVSGGPYGAPVSVDGRRVGQLPYVGAVRPGRHEVSVQTDSGTVEREVIVPIDELHEAEVDLSGETPRASARDDGGPRGAMLAGAGVLAAVGVGMAAASAVGVARGGSCEVGTSSGACVRSRETNVGPTVAFGVGAAAALAGAAVLAVCAFRGADQEVEVGLGRLTYRRTF